MTNFFTYLTGQALQPTTEIHPVIAARFEPWLGVAGRDPVPGPDGLDTLVRDVPGALAASAQIDPIVQVAVFTWIFGGKEGLFTGNWLFHMMAGGLIIGAFYMATDYVTGPSVRSAQVVFGVACGLLTVLIRLKGGYPEGVMFAILIMNCFAPLLDRGMLSKVFGKAEAKGVKK